MIAFLSSNGEFLEVVYVKDETEVEGELPCPKRAEWADQYAPYDPPAKAWMENGYTYTCFHCEHRLSLSDGYCDRCSGEHEEEDEDPRNAGIVFDGDVVYCGAGCQADDEAATAARKAKAAARDT